MENNYIKPNLSSNHFTCPVCFVASTFSPLVELPFSETKTIDKGAIKVLYLQSRCSRCNNNILWTSDHSLDRFGNRLNLLESRIIFPRMSIAPMPNKDIKGNDLDLYNEARWIFEDSPRAASALLRGLLENFLKRLFEIPDSNLGIILNRPEVKIGLGRNIFNYLINLKNISNDSIHSSKMVYDNENRDDVIKLFSGINIVFSRLVSEENEIMQLTQLGLKVSA